MAGKTASFNVPAVTQLSQALPFIMLIAFMLYVVQLSFNHVRCFMLFEVILYLYCLYSFSSWNQVGVLHCRQIPLFLTGWFVPVNLQHQDSTLVWFLDLLQSGQEAQGQWCCWWMSSWSSSKPNNFTTVRTWGKLAYASEWTHLNSGDTQNSSSWQSDRSNCASYWFHALSRYLDMACCFITFSDGKSNEICNVGN